MDSDASIKNTVKEGTKGSICDIYKPHTNFSPLTTTNPHSAHKVQSQRGQLRIT